MLKSYFSLFIHDPRDKLSAFMESKGAASPGMLTLTSNLSKVRKCVDFCVQIFYELLVNITISAISETRKVPWAVEGAAETFSCKWCQD